MNVGVNAALDHVDESFVKDVTVRLTDIPSVTGAEALVAEEYAAILSELGMNVRMQTVEQDRFNVIAVLPGTGGGRSLMLNGHLDTEVSGGEDLWEQMGFEKTYPPRAVVDKDWISGLGSYNMKGALACFAGAVLALQRSGQRLAGDLLISGVVGENGRAQVGSYTGATYRGGGEGTQHLVTHTRLPDAVIVGEPTDLAVVRGHMGLAWIALDVVTSIGHINDVSDTENAIVASYEVLRAMHDLHADLNQPSAENFDGLFPHVKVAAIEGGWPYRLSQSPGICTLYLDARCLPAHPPRHLVRLVEKKARQAAGEVGARVELRVFQSIPGVELSTDHELVKLVEDSHATAHTEAPTVAVRRYHTDATTFVRYGTPALNYGPSGEVMESDSGGISPHVPAGEAVRISKLVKATATYTLAARSWCHATSGDD